MNANIQIPTLDEIEEANRNACDAAAEEMEKLELTLQDPVFEIGRFVEYAPGKRLLDVGCSAARYVRYFTEAGFDYVGIDLSSRMIDLARRRHPLLRFEVMNYRQLRLEDRSFDCAWCCCALNYEAKRNVPNVLAELRRILVPGGIIGFVMPSFGESDERFLEKDGKRSSFQSRWLLGEFAKCLMNARLTILENSEYIEGCSMMFVVRS